MRVAALVTLVVLGSLNAASLSSLHVDHAQSHAVECAPTAPAPDCHAGTPHRHDAAHAGEESLFEHIFHESLEAAAAGIFLSLANLFSVTGIVVQPAALVALPMTVYTGPIAGLSSPGSVQSRAPPSPAG